MGVAALPEAAEGVVEGLQLIGAAFEIERSYRRRKVAARAMEAALAELKAPRRSGSR